MDKDLDQRQVLRRNRNNRCAKNLETRLATSWNRLLPTHWADLAEAPLHFSHYSEYEIAAERTVGYDADDRPCFTAYRFTLTSPASDDDETFYPIVTHSEEMAAWRLRDERWLVWREVHADEDCQSARSFYSLAQGMPR